MSETVALVVVLAITGLELFAFNLVLNLRVYRFGAYQQSVPAFLFAAGLWWLAAQIALRSMQDSLMMNLVVLSVCVLLFGAAAAVDLGIFLVKRAIDVAKNRTQSSPELPPSEPNRRGAAAILLAAVAWGATGAVATSMRRPGGHNETAAIGSLRAINSAQQAYSATCAGGGYATTLADLGRPPRGESQGFLSPDLLREDHVQYGYVFSLTRAASAGVSNIGTPAATCNGSVGQPVSAYFVSAAPVEPGRTGRRFFATDSGGTIYFSTKGPIANPIVVGGHVEVLQP